MKTLTLVRSPFYRTASATFGVLCDGTQPIAVTLELPWRNNKRNVSCIPGGVYRCTLADTVKRGKVYRVNGVTGRTGILIHVGNYPRDTQGCILPGMGFNLSDAIGNSAIGGSQNAMHHIIALCGNTFTLKIVVADTIGGEA